MSTYTKLDSYKCTVCGSLLWKQSKAQFPGCSNDKCGKSHPITFPTAARRRNHMLILGLPEVYGVLGKYELPGHRGYWVVVRKLSREVDPRGKDRLPDGHVYALEGTVVLELKPAETKK